MLDTTDLLPDQQQLKYSPKLLITEELASFTEGYLQDLISCTVFLSASS